MYVLENLCQMSVSDVDKVPTGGHYCIPRLVLCDFYFKKGRVCRVF